MKKGELVSLHVGSDEKELTEKIKAFSEGILVVFFFVLIWPGSVEAAEVTMEIERRTHYDYIVIGGGSGNLFSVYSNLI